MNKIRIVNREIINNYETRLEEALKIFKLALENGERKIMITIK